MANLWIIGLIAISGLVTSSESLAQGRQTRDIASVLTAQEISPSEDQGKEWTLFQGKEISMRLPDSFIGGNPQDFDLVLENMRRIGPPFSGMVSQVEELRDVLALWALDTNLSELGLVTSVSVAGEPVLSFITIEQYLDAFEQDAITLSTSLESEIVRQGGREYAKAISTVDQGTFRFKVLTFIERKGDKFYNVVFTTPEEEFTMRLPLFEESFLSLEFQE